MLGLSQGDAVIIAGLCASVAAQLVSLFRENRNHNWAIEEKRQEQQDRVILAAKVLKTSEDLSAQIGQASGALQEQIADNTAKTEHAANRADAAYQEANHVNMKIASLGVQALDARRADDERITPGQRTNRGGP